MNLCGCKRNPGRNYLFYIKFYDLLNELLYDQKT